VSGIEENTERVSIYYDLNFCVRKTLAVSLFTVYI
jgi:hypothetical protein